MSIEQTNVDRDGRRFANAHSLLRWNVNIANRRLQFANRNDHLRYETYTISGVSLKYKQSQQLHSNSLPEKPLKHYPRYLQPPTLRLLRLPPSRHKPPINIQQQILVWYKAEYPRSLKLTPMYPNCSIQEQEECVRKVIRDNFLCKPTGI